MLLEKLCRKKEGQLAHIFLQLHIISSIHSTLKLNQGKQGAITKTIIIIQSAECIHIIQSHPIKCDVINTSEDSFSRLEQNFRFKKKNNLQGKKNNKAVKRVFI